MMNETANYQIIFTEQGFDVDFPLTEDGNRDAELFRKQPWKAVYDLGFAPFGKNEESSFHFLHDFALTFIKELTHQSALEITREQTSLELLPEIREQLLDALPFCLGSENVTSSWIDNAWKQLLNVFLSEISSYDQSVALYFAEKLQDLRIPERIFFHIVENRNGDEPFAFLATYSTRDKEGIVRHHPLSYALIEYKNSKEKLLSLLSCLNKASDACPLIADLISSGELFYPLKLSSSETYEILKCVNAIEEAGISCRLPDWWRKRSYSPRLSVSMNASEKSLLGIQSLLEMTPFISVDGEKLSKEDIRNLLAQSEGLALIKGKWVEVDHEKLRLLLSEMDKYDGEISLLDSLRMQAGLEKNGKVEIEITNGAYCAKLLDRLRHPQKMKAEAVPDSVHACLRPYQETGYTWLNQMASLGFGACLADDMGLGKTLQVITYLASLKERYRDAKVLLIVPSSLVGNWEKEVSRFAPSLSVCILHGLSSSKLENKLSLDDSFLTVTTYGMATRLQGLSDRTWDCLILDEAQAIKNPSTQMSKKIKKIGARYRIAMTGTPIENNLSNLWSLFDFLNQGLLGSSKEFGSYVKNIQENSNYSNLKRIVSPFILRRLKTDKSIIADLPEKIEMTDYIELTKKQVALYNEEVVSLTEKIESEEGIKRKGLVLGAISHFKQICNHPDQYLGQVGYDIAESGKMQTLIEICETIRDKHERVLVFTQYREITPHLDKVLHDVFGRKGLVISGEVSAKERTRFVDEFCGDNYVPYMVLTIKAGGTGLNLTKANHVILFDRWWNPAVENQAIDRAFRIGQTKNVIVHKFITKSTIEEKIAALIQTKEELARDVIGASGEKWITEMSNQEILNLVKLEV
ncbi:MAG: DEAD/DEAH box helicase [Spirochaetales bacterium]|nr:DEAD/DEAH box helicase [Spirochaetales bacterium]